MTSAQIDFLIFLTMYKLHVPMNRWNNHFGLVLPSLTLLKGILYIPKPWLIYNFTIYNVNTQHNIFILVQPVLRLINKSGASHLEYMPLCSLAVMCIHCPVPLNILQLTQQDG